MFSKSDFKEVRVEGKAITSHGAEFLELVTPTQALSLGVYLDSSRNHVNSVEFYYRNKAEEVFEAERMKKCVNTETNERVFVQLIYNRIEDIGNVPREYYFHFEGPLLTKIQRYYFLSITHYALKKVFTSQVIE